MRVITLLLCLSLILSACTPAAPETPAVLIATSTPIPAAPLPLTPTLTPTATPEVDDGRFTKISRSAAELHLQCDPYAVVFSVTVAQVGTGSLAFFFRMKDKASGLVNPWSNVEMRPVGGDTYEYILQAKNLPGEIRYWDGWLQYQFVALDKKKQALAHSQIFTQELSYSPNCP